MWAPQLCNDVFDHVFFQAKDYIKANAKKDKVTADMASLLLERYKALLVENDYYGHYFARSAQTKDSLCDSQVRETMNVFIDLNLSCEIVLHIHVHVPVHVYHSLSYCIAVHIFACP